MRRLMNAAALARASTTCYVKIIFFQSPEALSRVQIAKIYRPTADFSRAGGFVVHESNFFLFAQNIYAVCSSCNRKQPLWHAIVQMHSVFIAMGGEYD